jgi:hypothetical protein
MDFTTAPVGARADHLLSESIRSRTNSVMKSGYQYSIFAIKVGHRRVGGVVNYILDRTRK